MSDEPEKGTRESIAGLLDGILGESSKDFLIPPPVYETIPAEVLEVDRASGMIRLRYPMLRRYLNPYGTMQGGVIAAAIDNTIGPLSMLVAEPNVTRTLELEYLHPAPGDLPHVDVRAVFSGRRNRRLTFEAEVFDDQGRLLARAHAVHLVVPALNPSPATPAPGE